MVGAVGLVALVIDGMRLVLLDKFRLIADIALNDQVHLAAFGQEGVEVRDAAAARIKIEPVDAEAVALMQHVANPLWGVILHHYLVKRTVEVGEPIELVAAAEQTADLDVAELHLGNLDFRRRFGRPRRLLPAATAALSRSLSWALSLPKPPSRALRRRLGRRGLRGERGGPA